MLTYTGPKCIMTAEGTHDPSRTYEALDVVYDSVSGNSYVAKIDVPVGASLSDTTYWSISANPSQAITGLQTDVAALQVDMAQAKTDITGKVNTADVLTSKQDVVATMTTGKLVDATVLKDVVKMNVIDNLASSSTTDALSANQGKVLEGKIPTIEDNLSSTSTSNALSANQGRVLNEKISSLTNMVVATSYVDGALPLEQCLSNLVIQLSSRGGNSYVMATIVCNTGIYFATFYADAQQNGMGTVCQYGPASYTFYVQLGQTAILKTL